MKTTRLARWLSFSAADAFGRFGLQIASTVIFARLLAPELFGQAALAMVIVQVLSMAVTEPFEEALARKALVRKVHLQACLFALLAVAAAICVATWVTVWGLASSLEAGHARTVATLVGVYSLTLFALAPTGVFTAVLRRHRRFTVIAVANLAGLATGTAVGVAMAFAGFGVWSLIAVRLVSMFVKAAWIVVGARARVLPAPALAPLREMSDFAGWYFASRSIQAITDAAFQSLVTLLHGVAANGYLNMATRIVSPLQMAVGPIGQNISVSVFARLQSTPDRLRIAIERSIVQTSLLLLPIFVGMASVASTLIVLLAGPSWHESVEIAIFLALAAAMMSAANYINWAVTAHGRVDLRFIGSILGLAGMAAGMFALLPLGTASIGPARFLGFFAIAAFCVWLGHHLFRLDYAAIARQFLPVVLASAVMAAGVVYLPAALPSDLPLIVVLICQIAAGVAIYGVAATVLAGATLRDALQQLVRPAAEST